MNSVFRPKFFTLLKSGISRQQAIDDTMAGIVVGIVALPLAIAFAVASGVSPEKGIITAVVAGLIISVFGGSRVQIGGPTGAFIVIVYGIVTQYGIDGLIISTIMAGVLLVLFGVLKLGALLKYIPHPLIVGFTSGIALVIFSTQIADAFGLEIADTPSGFLAKWQSYFAHIQTFNPVAAAFTAFTILVVVYFPKISRKIPGSFVAILVTTLAVVLFDLPVTTIESFFGDIPNKIQLTIPQFEWSQLINYIPPAITIALLGGIESLLSAVVADGMIGGNHRSNTELIGQGIANIVTPFFGGIPATGAIARTATNVKNNGRTPIAGIVHAITLLLIMLFLGNYAKLIPMSCLAGILIVVAYNMSEWRSFKSVLTTSALDSVVLVTTFLLTVLVDLTVAIEVGIVLSSLLFMKRMADMSGQTVGEQIDGDVIDDYSKVPKEISIYEVSGPLFFASARTYAETIRRMGLKSKVLIIRMRHVPFIDTTGMHNLRDTLKTLHANDTVIVLSGVNSDVAVAMQKHNMHAYVRKENMCDNFDDAMQKALQIVGKA
jgi:SulP family sulfate permease